MTQGKFRVRFRPPTGMVREAVGREAETLVALVRAGPNGITSLEAFRAGWAVRLAAYVCDLRLMGVPIRTVREAHAGGSHARYSLEARIDLLWRSDRASAAA